MLKEVTVAAAFKLRKGTLVAASFNLHKGVLRANRENRDSWSNNFCRKLALHLILSYASL